MAAAEADEIAKKTAADALTPELVHGPRWTDYIDVENLVPDPRNPKGHANDDLDKSLARFGFTESPMIDERTGRLVAGHGRRELVLRARAANKPAPDGIVVTDDGRWLVPVERGWRSQDDDEALAYIVASNRMVELGGWEASIAGTIQELSNTALGLEGVGYTNEDLDRMLAEAEAAAGGDGGAEGGSSGALLAAADVTVGEPKHVVEVGQTWQVGRHMLVVADLMTQHSLWRDRLVDGVLFCPYPGPFVALGSKVELDHVTLLLVQPDTYIAGHILDKWVAIHGDEDVRQVAAA